MFHRLLRSFLIAVGFCFLPFSAKSQTGTTATITSPNSDDFPIIHSYLRVYSEDGDFYHDLQKDDVTAIEDNQEIPVSELTELEPGVQFVVAVNLGPPFAIRDNSGISRNDRIQEALSNWASNQSSNNNDFSFLTNDEPENIHLDSAIEWLNSFNFYGTNPRTAVPSLDVLTRAIEVASDPVPRLGMGRAVLLLTPPPAEAGTATLQSIIDLANQEGVKIFIWMVSSPTYFTSQGATLLANIAEQSGGSFFAFSGVEELPDVNDYIEPLRYVFSISYDSKIRTSGSHQVYTQIAIGNQMIGSPTQRINVEVSPPNPIFISPPVKIIRANKTPFVESLAEEGDFTPEEQVIEILVEFPDGHPRTKAKTVLYVDGKIADENTQEPFDVFSWNLKEYKTSSSHTLQVEVEDSLGLKNSSIEHKVDIVIQLTPQSVISSVRKNAPLIAGVIAAIAGGILVLVLIVGGHIKPNDFGPKRKKLSKGEKKQTLEEDAIPDLGFYNSNPQNKRMPKWLNKIAWSTWDRPTPQPVAFLDPFNDIAKSILKNPIPLPIGETTFGRDSTAVKIPLNNAALEKIHTKLKITRDEILTIYDQDTRAGTWVNYQPISSSGTILAHGDIIHIGDVGLRLKLTDKTRIPKALVIPVEPDLDD
jgi:hypothetical protein